MRKFAAVLALVPCLFGQVPYASSRSPSTEPIENYANRGAAAVWQSLKKLHTRASLIMITAHPDDEDGGMLVWASRGIGARVALLTLNRGEGGANVMSPDYFDALGLVRTEELLAAGRYYGVDQYWTRMIDYGFSKTLEESLSKWGHDNVLRDVVRVLRTTRPLVVTSVFVGGPSDGHGNHQAAGLLAKEVFQAAADPKVFPEQIREGLHTWAPLKDYAHVPFFGPDKDKLEANVEVPEDAYDPLLGFSYSQVSREGLGHQKSQNGGTGIPAVNSYKSPYHRFASKIPVKDKEDSFFDGIDISLEGIASLVTSGDSRFLRDGLREINADVEKARTQFSATHPEAIAGLLADGLKKTGALIDRVKSSSLSESDKYDVIHELDVKQVQFNDGLAAALGISVRATVAPDQPLNPLYARFLGDPDTFRVAIPGQAFKVNVHVASQSESSVTLSDVALRNTDGKSWSVKGSGIPAGALKSRDAVDIEYRVQVPGDAVFTRPYFSRPNIEQPYYTINDERYLDLPRAPYPLEAWAEFRFGAAAIQVGQVVQSVKRVTGYGAVLEPLVVGPAISVAIAPRAGIVPLHAKSFPVTVILHSNVKGQATGGLRLELPSGWRSEPATMEFSTAQDGEDQSVAFQVTPSNLEEREYQITAVADYGGKQYREGYHITGYAGLRPYFLYSPSTYRTSGVDVNVAPGLKVGYITGSGDDVPASLAHLGIKVTSLGPAELATGDLSGLDVILLGVRTYAAREDLKTNNGRLLDYVRNGGVVVVQYNTPEFDHNYGPYPYVMSQDPEEVTDEASRVDLLNPGHPVFTWPNKITAKDFEGWVEERGSKFLKSWDSRYEALLSTHDAGQEPQKGGLLYARYGKGIWIYNAYAFYRELPEGVPGAYRLFANLLSLPRNPNVNR